MVTEISMETVLVITDFKWKAYDPSAMWNYRLSDVGDIVMLVTLLWWLILDANGRIIMLTTFFVILVIFSMY